MAPRMPDPRSITAAGFARLLARLDANPDRAALEYEQLRRALVKFFDWRGAWAPEECADDTIDRLARRLEADTQVVDIKSYALGIARLLLLERRRQPTFSPIDEHPGLVGAAAPGEGAGDDRLHDCFEGCLEQIPAESRSLVIEYYVGERRQKIANRRRLASALGVSENALRSRVQRLRDRLEHCVENCLESGLKDEL